MTLEGTIQNGVVILDQGGAQIPDGTRVEVVVRELPEQQKNKGTLRDRLLGLAGTVDDLPADMARNHDHYIHGAPKR